ncbi:MAG: sulfatase-like hydrolase/transferase [Planctomycetia bacterium]|nr:sulfatase-like hydrolase/transferase [Planctomycetia bacterium]
MNHSKRNVVCLVINGLNIGFLGAYGNSWVQTPGFDLLASQSTLFDQYYIHSPHLISFYEAVFRGTHPAVLNSISSNEYSEAQKCSLPQLFNFAGYRTVLITDDSEVAFHSASTEFSDIKLIDIPDRSSPVDIVEESHFYSFFAQIMDQIIEIQTEIEDIPFFIWGHFSGWSQIWDFPLDNRLAFVDDEDDPDPYSDIIVPSAWISLPNKKQTDIKSFVQDSSFLSPNQSPNILDDLDKKQSIQEAYCGGISVFDKALDEFCQVFQSNAFWNDSLFLLTSNRGFPLGEHQQIGNDFLNLYSEELHLPLLIHFPDQEECFRSSALVDPCDIFVTLASFSEKNQISNAGIREPVHSSLDDHSSQLGQQYFQIDQQWGNNLLNVISETNDSRAFHEYLLIVEKDALSQNRVVVTNEWFLRQTIKINLTNDNQPERPHYELFVLPDDRWNVNEVADRCEKELEKLIPLLTLSVKS